MTLSSLLVPSSGVLFGNYPGTSCDSTTTNGATLFRNFETLVDRTPTTNGPLDIVHFYHDWNDFTTTFPTANEDALVAEGRLLFVNWTPRIYGSSTIFRWPDITAGTYDASYIDPTARAMAAWGQKFFIAFHTEMNSGSSVQGGPYGTDAEYAAAAQHVHDRFLAQGCSNAIWVFNPSGHSDMISRIGTLYPGDAYVDWIGYDPYSTTGESLDYDMQTKWPVYGWATSTKSGSHTKPLIWCEWGAKENTGGTSKATYFDQVRTQLLGNYPQVKAIVYFNSTSTVSECLNTSTAALQHFQTLAADGNFNPDLSVGSPPVAQGAFRAGTATAFSSATSAQLAIPSGVQAGDGMLLWHGSTRTGLKNACEGTNATNVTLANSNAAGSNPIDVVTTTAPQYDTSQKHSGNSSWHCSLTSGTDCHGDWVSSFPWPTAAGTSYYGRIYYRYSANPSAAARIASQFSAANANQWGIAIDTNGKIIVRDTAAGATRGTSSATPATATQHRVEWQATWNGSQTTVTVRLYLGGSVDSATPTETFTSTAFNQAAAPGRMKWGLVFSAANTYDIYIDDFGLDPYTWMGPIGTSPALTAPSGWVEVVPTGTQSVAAGAGDLATKCYRRTATAGDPGSTLTLSTDVAAHGAIGLVAYSGVDQLALVDVAAASTKSADSTTVVTPNVTSTGANEWVVSFGVVRDNPGGLSTAWTMPGGEAQRAAAFGAGTADGRVACVASDDGTSHAAGTYGTKTLTANATSYLGVGWTVAVKSSGVVSSGSSFGLLSYHN